MALIFDSGSPSGPRTPLRQAIDAAVRLPEGQALGPLWADARPASPASRAAIETHATQLISRLRSTQPSDVRAQRVQALLQEYALSTPEGVALMCLAEALLRIPDDATCTALIRDKIRQGQWDEHVGRSPSLFVNAASWGLVITGTLMQPSTGVAASLQALTGRLTEPLIRKAMELALEMLGEQFVTGETIEQALRRAQTWETKGFRYSYDMLGEAAATEADAQRYAAAYEAAIHAIGRAAQGRGVVDGPGISIKLSALHPRWGRAQRQRVLDELIPRVLHLAQWAQRYNLGFNIDAEEADRLDLSLDVLEALAVHPTLGGPTPWQGLGFVVQAYQKRCPAVIDTVVELARHANRRLMVRLVKGAYWDTEIKRAQVDGLSDYPVYTRKSHTDVSYLACARRLLRAPDAVFPQFATHNAHTVASIVQMGLDERGAWHPAQYEFQCLHGMGEPLYAAVADSDTPRPCRIYAPVGTHETLLAYLVRRLLENGANSSFVHRMADPSVAPSELVQCPIETEPSGTPHPNLPIPPSPLAAGYDLSHEPTLQQLATSMTAAGANLTTLRSTRHNPADPSDLLNSVPEADADAIEHALQAAWQAAEPWANTPADHRAQCLHAAADQLQASAPVLLSLLIREAGKTWPHAVAELREAIDFLRYYAVQAHTLHITPAAGWQPLGPVTCISPWNFPLAIFIGQIAAALAAGNTVLAKPAEATPLIADQAVQALWAAGVPRHVLHCLQGQGSTVGQALVRDARVQGVLFTGSTHTARHLQSLVSHRLNRHGQPVTLVAETGGQNCMIVDASALLEQVAVDVLASAFEAAGQRCSALRVLFVQDEVADRLLELLRGAMAQLQWGAPHRLATDVGPLISAAARDGVLAHIEGLRAAGFRVFQASGLQGHPGGHWVPPTLIEIDRLERLSGEVFGPVLHVVRWRQGDLPDVLEQIEATGYALTLGIHSRIQRFIDTVVEGTRAGNVYVNRSQVGAVVGVQPFGGEGLSGTGPKAGGPLLLPRLMAYTPVDCIHQVVLAPAAARLAPAAQTHAPRPTHHHSTARTALHALRAWAASTGRHALVAACTRLEERGLPGLCAVLHLPGPTGEDNQLWISGRREVLCAGQLGHSSQAPAGEPFVEPILLQLAATWAVGGHPQLTESARDQLTCCGFPETLWPGSVVRESAMVALVHSDDAVALVAWLQWLAARPGPVVVPVALPTHQHDIPLERLLAERTVCTNTTAAGGNAQLLTLSERDPSATSSGTSPGTA